MNLLGFTRQLNGYRAWFPVSKNGLLQTGLPPSAFTITVLDVSDGASHSPAVSESTQKPGMYFFDVTQSFLASNGVGSYGMLAEVNTAGVKAVAGGVLQVTEDDLRSMHLVRYGGAVHIDTAGGVAGTAPGVGTEDNPSSNIADALTIATRNGIRRFHVRGSVTLTVALPDWQVFGDGEEAELNFNGQDVADSEFFNMKVTGLIGTGPVRLDRCYLDGVSGLRGTADFCSLLAGTTTLSGATGFYRCVSGVPGTGYPIIDLDSLAIGVEVRDYAGSFGVANLANAGATFSADMLAGRVIVEASCTAMQTGRLAGTAHLVDNGSIATWNLDGLVSFDTIWRLKDIPPASLL